MNCNSEPLVFFASSIGEGEDMADIVRDQAGQVPAIVDEHCDVGLTKK